MKIVTEKNYAQNVQIKNRPICVRRFETPTDSFEKTNQNSSTPSFKAGINIYKEILNNPEKAKKFMELLTLGIGSLIAASKIGEKDSETAQTDTPDIWSTILNGFQPKAESTEPEETVSSENTELEKLQKENDELKDEISKLKHQFGINDDSKFVDDMPDNAIRIIGTGETISPEDKQAVLISGNESTETPEEPVVDDMPDNAVRIIGTGETISPEDKQSVLINVNESTETPEEPVADKISDNEIHIIGEETMPSTESTETKVFTQVTAENNRIKFVFPPKHGRLSHIQQELKEALSNVYLTKDEIDKLTEICNILLTKTYKTESGLQIDCEGLTEKILEQLNNNKASISKIIEICYSRLELNKQKDDNLVNDSTANETPASTNSEDLPDGITPSAKVINATIGENPVCINVVGKIDLDKISDKKRNKQNQPVPQNEINSLQQQENASDTQQELTPTDKTSFEEADNPVRTPRKRIQHPQPQDGITIPEDTEGSISSEYLVEDLSAKFHTKLDTTPDNPTISFPYYAVRTSADLFALPYKSAYIVKNQNAEKGCIVRPKYGAGAFTEILINFENYYHNPKCMDDVKAWAKSIKGDSEPTIYFKTDKCIAKNVNSKDIENELKHYDCYNNIENASDFNPAIFDDIAEAINQDERFQNFSFHGAVRLIERFVDFESDVSIQDQCHDILDRLFELFRRTFNTGVQIETYARAEKKGEKGIVITLAPDIIISADNYTEDEKKFFKNEKLTIALCEYQPGNYDKMKTIPIIKTIY